jgi:GNAT superfamily N-acetyltransferase
VDVLALQRPGQRAFYRLFDGASPGARVVERDDGVLVCVCPARPERSLVNCVLYDNGEAVVRALSEVADEFSAAGVEAWAVWVAPGDEAVAAVCAAAGMTLDATPELMWAAVDDVVGRAPSRDGVVLDPAPTWKALADDAVGFRAVARDDEGRAVAGAGVVVAGDVAEVVMVATVPAARGQGLASACIRSCLSRSGARWTTLEATKMGEPLYAHMGYARAGAYGMWEARVAEIVG